METTTKTKARNKQAKSKENGNHPETENKMRRPSEEEIRQKAQEIYNERLVRGEYGTALDDWQKAEQLLNES